MPNKTIYVADDDLPLFSRAQELAGGNLSGAVAMAIRRFVEAQEARVRDMQEITLPVGAAGTWHRKRFIGALLARWRHRMSDQRVEAFAVYQTGKGKFAVYRRIESDWGQWENWGNWENWASQLSQWTGSEWNQSGESTLDVYETMVDLAAAVPPELASLVEQKTAEPVIEDLDI